MTRPTLSARPPWPQVSVGKVFNMRLLSLRATSRLLIAGAATCVFATPRASLRAADLDQLLTVAVENSQSGAEPDKSDKSDKPAATTSDKPKEEGNGAKKDEDTSAKPAAKPAAEPAPEKPKPKYPPYAELLKEAKKMEGLITLQQKDDTIFAEIGIFILFYPF